MINKLNTPFYFALTNQGEDLYYTNYHLKIELDVSVKIIELKISRDNAEYIVKCSVEMFTK